VGIAAFATFGNSLANGFALDDNWFIVENEVVTEGRYSEAFTQGAWPGAGEGRGNYRPVALSSFAAEWSLWQDAPFGYHLVSVIAHVGVSLLVLVLLLKFVSLLPAVIGATFFAIHPVHVEAVANVMGRAELYAAAAYIGACLVYLRAADQSSSSRGWRLFSVLLLFVLALGSKEIAVTLPAMVVALEVYRRSEKPARSRLSREGLSYVALFAMLGVYVLVRWNAIGDLTGEGAAAGLQSLDTPSRILSALTVWPHYLRLLVFPVDLSADYSPAVLVPTTSVTLDVVAGALLLTAGAAGAIAFAAFVVAGLCSLVRTATVPKVQRAAAIFAVFAGVGLLGRSIARNPSWKDTFTMLSTLTRDHPESWMSQRALAVGFVGAQDMASARSAYEAALDVAPDHYQLLVEAALFYDDIGEAMRAEELFEQAIAVLPGRPEAYSRMAERRVLRGDGRGAHAAALRGVARTEEDRELWAVVSESYIMKADLEAAVRARRASIGAEPTPAGWARLGDLLEALERPEAARAARAEADRMYRG
jgi:Flp pilus assembly protein TadD